MQVVLLVAVPSVSQKSSEMATPTMGVTASRTAVIPSQAVSSLPASSSTTSVLPTMNATKVAATQMPTSRTKLPPAGFLLVSESTQIRVIDPDSSSPVFSAITGLGRVVDVDYDAVSGKVFWVDSVQKVLAKQSLNASVRSASAKVIATNLTAPYGIAVDWIGSLVFFTEQSQDFIGVVSMDGAYAMPVLLLESVDNPGPIAVDPERGSPLTYQNQMVL